MGSSRSSSSPRSQLASISITRTRTTQGAGMTATQDTPPQASQTTFSTDVAGLDECTAPALVDLADGEAFELRIAPVVKQIGSDRVRMIAYNGSIPGPTLRVRQGSEISVRVHNEADTEATVHWHGLCLDNKYDGVP